MLYIGRRADSELSYALLSVPYTESGNCQEVSTQLSYFSFVHDSGNII